MNPMRFVFIFAGVFITLYAGAFFYVGVKKFDYTSHQKAGSINQHVHTSQTS
jgi:hypothetical protein